MGRLVIYGTGGFGREVATTARNCGRAIVFLSDNPVSAFDFGQIVHQDDLEPDDEIVIAIADGAIRRSIAARLSGFATLIAPTSIVGHGVKIGEGSILCDHTIVTASASIGRHFHANIFSYVAHDCVIGDFVTFGPGVQCNGNVHVGDGAYIGSGANIRNGKPGTPLRIGAGAFVAMGAIVVQDVPAGALVAGNPARIMREAGRDASTSL